MDSLELIKRKYSHKRKNWIDNNDGEKKIVVSSANYVAVSHS